MTPSARQGLFILFIFLELFMGSYFLKFSMFENLIIISLAAIILKLTDIEDALIKWKL